MRYGNDYKYYIKDYDRNIIKLYFSSIPNYSLRSTLKRNYWRYNPEEMCWFTYLSNDSEHIAKSIGAIDGTLTGSNSKLSEAKMDLDSIRYSASKMFNHTFSKHATLDFIKIWMEIFDSTPTPQRVLLKYSTSTNEFGIQITNCDDNIITLFFTDDTNDINGSSVLSLDETFALEVIDKIIREMNYVLYDSEVYRISSIAYTPRFESIINHSRMLQSDDNDVSIQVYKLKLPCAAHKRSVQMVTAYVNVKDGQNVKPLNVYYCPVCQKYYINAEQYRSFAKKYGLPFIKIERYASEENSINYQEWNDESVLHYMGYNVGVTDDLTATERQDILRHAIETGSMTKAEVVSHLEFLIHQNMYNVKFENACSKWKDDLTVISNYDILEQDAVKAVFDL